MSVTEDIFKLGSKVDEDTQDVLLGHKEDQGFGSPVHSEPTNNPPIIFAPSQDILVGTLTLPYVPCISEAIVQMIVDSDAHPPLPE